jgi:hypothetical protein
VIMAMLSPVAVADTVPLFGLSASPASHDNCAQLS